MEDREYLQFLNPLSLRGAVYRNKSFPARRHRPISLEIITSKEMPLLQYLILPPVTSTSRLRFRPQWKGCDLVYWMLERFAAVPQSEKQTLGYPQNSLGTWGVAKTSWGVAWESASDICCRFAFWGAAETYWGVSTLEIVCPLHAGCYLPQEQGEGKHMEPGRKDPSSWSTLCRQSFTFVTWRKKKCSQASASAAQSQAAKVGTELKGK